jgi:hypothetical protein
MILQGSDFPLQSNGVIEQHEVRGSLGNRRTIVHRQEEPAVDRIGDRRRRPDNGVCVPLS